MKHIYSINFQCLCFRIHGDDDGINDDRYMLYVHLNILLLSILLVQLFILCLIFKQVYFDNLIVRVSWYHQISMISVLAKFSNNLQGRLPLFHIYLTFNWIYVLNCLLSIIENKTEDRTLLRSMQVTSMAMTDLFAKNQKKKFLNPLANQNQCLTTEKNDQLMFYISHFS